MDLSKHTKEIKKLLKKKLRDKEIGEILGLSDRWIRECRKISKLRPSFKVGRPRKDQTELKKIICKLINKEHPQLPLSDYEIERILNKQGIEVTRNKVFRMRLLMKIPPSRGQSKIDLNRQYLYFTEGHYTWRYNGKHIIKRRNK